VSFDGKLQFKEHMHEKINKAYMMLGFQSKLQTYVYFYFCCII